MRHFFALLMILATASIHAQTAGSLDLSDVEDVLGQKKILWDRVKTDFDVFPTGDSRMINRSENADLNGARIGPYSFFVKPKGASGPYSYEMTVETKPTFMGKDGREVALAKASDFKEELTGIAIRPLLPEKYFTPLPNQRR